jgi:hypothetical protein
MLSVVLLIVNADGFFGDELHNWIGFECEKKKLYELLCYGSAMV